MATSELTKTIFMIREPRADGTFRYRRIPWDMANVNGTSGLQPMPMGLTFDEAFAVAGTDRIQIGNDMFFDDESYFDEITDIMWFTSENELLAVFDHVTAYYTTDSNQSMEMSYPRS